MSTALVEYSTDTTLYDALETMTLIRLFEEKVARLREEGLVPFTCTSVGQEAAATGVIDALEKHDLIVTNHRSAGHLLARGADPGRLMAEILGKATGYCRGKSGSLHVSARELGVILTSTIVGGELSLAPGVALSLAMHGSDAIAVCIFGDGAACEGIFHEALNLAAVWKLPILFVCENNQWQAYVHRRETMLIEQISTRAASYGMPGASVDGNCYENVLSAAKSAVEYVRTNRRPFLLETITYRLRGHMEPDDQSYVDPEELAAWKRRDPIDALRARLIENGLADASMLDALNERCEAAVERAARFAIESPWPSSDELTVDVWA